jgi:hypothetical protein
VIFLLGKALLALQYGHSLSMPLSRPMPEVAAGVEELRVKDRSGQSRDTDVGYRIGAAPPQGDAA